MSLRTASTWLKVAFGCTLLADLLFIIGFATVSWMTWISSSWYENELGLWKSCHRGRCGKTASYGWYRATQAMECLGLICILLATLILLLYMFVTSMKKRNALLMTLIFTFAAVLFIIIGVAIFASKYDTAEVGWSMGLAIAAAILAFIAGIMEVIEYK